MVPRWRIFGDFLRPVFSVSRVQHVTDLHLKFALRPHHVWKYSRHVIQCATAENRPGKKDRKKKEKKKPQDEDIMACPIPYGGIGRAIKNCKN